MDKIIVACDLDGTLARYDGWKGENHIGEVIPSIKAAIESVQKEGGEVWIFTARLSGGDVARAHTVIESWLAKNGIKVSGVTATKYKFFTHFWDDRAIQVVKNEGAMVLRPGDNYLPVIDVNHFDPAPFTPAEPDTAFGKQEGGNHYQKYAIQPIEFMHKNNIPSVASQIIKYVIRHQDKNGLEDLRKARHLLSMLMEMDYGVTE